MKIWLDTHLEVLSANAMLSVGASLKFNRRKVSGAVYIPRRRNWPSWDHFYVGKYSGSGGEIRQFSLLGFCFLFDVAS